MKSRGKFVSVAVITAMLAVSLAAVNAGENWEKHCENSGKSQTAIWAAICSLKSQIDSSEGHTHAIYRVESTKTIPAGFTDSNGVFHEIFEIHSVLCDPGDLLTGGGAHREKFGATILDFYPASDNNWTVSVVNTWPYPTNVTFYAICLDSTP